MAGFFERASIVAKPGYSRWWIAPAALAIHLSIGQAYAFSVFNLPLARAIGIDKPADGDWKLTSLGWIFTTAIAFLGISAATFGKWLERVGPRTSGLAAAACFGSGLLVAAIGVSIHQLAVVILGYGVLGGIGLGLGYITPVSTLVNGFPDRRGMATGIAIMGFGGGAILAAPLSNALMKHFASASSVGVRETFVVLGVLYAAIMCAGALSFRVPAEGWAPAGWKPPAHVVHGFEPTEAMKTRQFWLLWGVLCLNVTAGIGVLGQASAMIQEVFKGRVDAADGARFVALLSGFNMVGRFFWASLSDKIGRKRTYAIFFALGTALYLVVPTLGNLGPITGFVVGFAAILPMYGGGFATLPAYLSDLFGKKSVGAIHGRLLTAWSVAGVAGPVLVNYLRQYQIDHGVEKAQAYNVTMRVMACLLVIGFGLNAAVKPTE